MCALETESVETETDLHCSKSHKNINNHMLFQRIDAYLPIKDGREMNVTLVIVSGS